MAMAYSTATSSLHFYSFAAPQSSFSHGRRRLGFFESPKLVVNPPPLSSTHCRPPPPRLLTVQSKSTTRREDRTARHSRVRKKVEGTAERPRLCVFRSNKHIFVQVIDDTKMHTLASCSTMQKTISDLFDYTSAPTIDVAKKVGEVIAKSCVEKGIAKVAFDRGGYPYHGRVKALADAAREHGLLF